MVNKTIYVYRWGKYRPELKGAHCIVLARGTFNSALVQFLATGERVIVIRNALRKLKPGESAQKENDRG